jgi:DNA modification methylase
MGVNINNNDVSFNFRKLIDAVKSNEMVSGLTHNFYRYPARFSPKFVCEAINQFSNPGDLILDPFVGGGTTLVEALTNNRHSIGFDVSPIAAFVSEVKTTILNETQLEEIHNWAEIVSTKTIKNKKSQVTFYDDEGYLNNLPWTIKKSIEILLEDIELLNDEYEQKLVKCAILKTAQWAIDCRKNIPSSKEFRKKFLTHINLFIKGTKELATAVSKNSFGCKPRPMCIISNSSAENICNSLELKSLPQKPKLVITSPPYIGVQVLYHQWQVQSRKRTRTPFWVINSLDGHGSSFYTFGHYTTHSKKKYFEVAENAFKSIHSVLHDDGIIVQLVGFSNHKNFLNKYLK